MIATRNAGALCRGALGRFLYRRFNLPLRLIMPYAYGDQKKRTRAIHGQYLAAFPMPRAGAGAVGIRPRVDGLGRTFRFALAAARPVGRRAHPDPVGHAQSRARAVPSRTLARRTTPHAQVVKLEEAGHWPHEEAPDAGERVRPT